MASGGDPFLCYCFASRRASRHLSRLYEVRLAPAGVTSSQFSILWLIDHNAGITVSDLADTMEMERTTLVRALRPLRESGFISDGDEKVGRAAILKLSPTGVVKLEESLPLWQAAQNDFEEAVGTQAAEHFRGVTASAIARSGG